MKPGVTTRLAVHADAEAILDCLRAAFAPYRAMYTQAAYAATVLTPDTLAQRFNSMTIVVACAGPDTIAGTVAWCAGERNHGRIRGMAVRPDWEGVGVATALLFSVESELKGLAVERVVLDTVEPLRRAARFYESRGFCRAGTVKEFFGMPLFEYHKSLV